MTLRAVYEGSSAVGQPNRFVVRQRHPIEVGDALSAIGVTGGELGGDVEYVIE
ncbi:hypothetical protein [Enhygromyxa salina]|uniref:hypothetical protein n=1 Tax=Enhygromyxa salina TaxID=215803 RepID=UPI0015E7360D|nr:hypothetical protein [Enhygromyxa salina]